MFHLSSPHRTGLSSRKVPWEPEEAVLRSPHLPLPFSLSPSCLTGYVNHSLSVFHTKDFQDPIRIEGSENVTECRSGFPQPP